MATAKAPSLSGTPSKVGLNGSGSGSTTGWIRKGPVKVERGVPIPGTWPPPWRAMVIESVAPTSPRGAPALGMFRTWPRISRSRGPAAAAAEL
jgi:hypothetical protein